MFIALIEYNIIIYTRNGRFKFLRFSFSKCILYIDNIHSHINTNTYTVTSPKEHMEPAIATDNNSTNTSHITHGNLCGQDKRPCVFWHCHRKALTVSVHLTWLDCLRVALSQPVSLIGSAKEGSGELLGGSSRGLTMNTIYTCTHQSRIDSLGDFKSVLSYR